MCVCVHQPCGRECLPERRRSTVCGTLCTDHNVPNTDQVLLRAARWCSTGHAARDLGLRHAACSSSDGGRRGGDVATGVLGWVGRTVGRRRRMMRGRRREAVPACTGRHRGSAVSSASSSIPSCVARVRNQFFNGRAHDHHFFTSAYSGGAALSLPLLPLPASGLDMTSVVYTTSICVFPTLFVPQRAQLRCPAGVNISGEELGEPRRRMAARSWVPAWCEDEKGIDHETHVFINWF